MTSYKFSYSNVGGMRVMVSRREELLRSSPYFGTLCLFFSNMGSRFKNVINLFLLHRAAVLLWTLAQTIRTSPCISTLVSTPMETRMRWSATLTRGEAGVRRSVMEAFPSYWGRSSRCVCVCLCVCVYTVQHLITGIIHIWFKSNHHAAGNWCYICNTHHCYCRSS